MNASIEFLKHYLWLCFLAIFARLRGIIWWFRGISETLRESSRLDFKGKSVHVQRILLRFNIDPISLPLTDKAFLTVHDSFQDSSYLLKDSVTLMNFTDKVAVFIETDDEEDIFNCRFNAFFSVAQFKLAQKLITIPLCKFHQLADSLPDIKARLVFISCTARCGSTLLKQVFQGTGRARAWSEPDTMNALTQLKGKFSEAEADRIAVNVVKLMCKPTKKDFDAYVIKIQAPAMPIVRQLHRLFPEAKQLFSYRDGLPNIRSFTSIIDRLPLLKLLVWAGRLSGTLTSFIVRMSGNSDDFLKETLKSDNHYTAMVWASGIYQYLAFRKACIPISAVKYENLVENPREACRKIYKYLDLEYTHEVEEAILKTLEIDSQRDSPLAKRAHKNSRAEVIDDVIMEHIKQVCDHFGLPHVTNPFVLAGTITSTERNVFGM